jgi:hypothetical protein
LSGTNWGLFKADPTTGSYQVTEKHVHEGKPLSSIYDATTGKVYLLATEGDGGRSFITIDAKTGKVLSISPFFMDQVISVQPLA